MWIRLKENRAFRSTVEGEDIRVGMEPVEVKDSIGKYLLKSFPVYLELAPKKSEEDE